MTRLALAVAAMLIASPASAKICGDSKFMADELAKKYGERPTAFGIQADGTMLQLYVSSKTGTWTAVISMPNKRSCIVGAGKQWHTLPTVVAGDDA